MIDVYLSFDENNLVGRVNGDFYNYIVRATSFEKLEKTIRFRMLFDENLGEDLEDFTFTYFISAPERD